MTSSQKGLLALGVVAAVVLAYWMGTRRGGEHGTTTTSADPDASVTILGSAAASASAAPSASSALDGLDLGSRLGAEREKAGKGDPSASAVFDAIQKKLALPLEDRKQVAGWMVGAEFCERANTKNGVYIVVCEFKDNASALLGQKSGSNTVIKRREVLVKRTSTCAVQQAGETPEAIAAAGRIKDLFRTM